MWKPTPEGGDPRLKYSAKVTLSSSGPGWCPSCGAERTRVQAWAGGWRRGQQSGWGGQSASQRSLSQGDPLSRTWQPAPVSSVQYGLGPRVDNFVTLLESSLPSSISSLRKMRTKIIIDSWALPLKEVTSVTGLNV